MDDYDSPYLRNCHQCEEEIIPNSGKWARLLIGFDESTMDFNYPFCSNDCLLKYAQKHQIAIKELWNVNICSTEDVVKYIMLFGDRGYSVSQLMKHTNICVKSCYTGRPNFLFDQLERLTRNNHLIEIDGHYTISPEYYARLNRSITIKRPNVKSSADYIAVSIVELAKVRFASDLSSVNEGEMLKFIYERVDNIIDVIIEQDNSARADKESEVQKQ